MGCATYAELGTMIPESGGEYAYLFRCYGQLYAFLFSWTCNWILKPSGIAIVCLVCGQYITQPFYLNGGAPTWMCKGKTGAIRS